MTLTEFLLARISEDEAAARLVESEGRSSRYESVEDHGGWLILSIDPARVLAECEAKRRIVEVHEIDWTLSDYEQSWGGKEYGCVVCHEFDGITCGRGYCDTLRALALPYADHPDCDEEWKP